MAKVDISVEGVASLRQFASDLNNFCTHTEDNYNDLKNAVSADIEEVGIAKNDIEEMLVSVGKYEELGRTAVDSMVVYLNQKADLYESLLI